MNKKMSKSPNGTLVTTSSCSMPGTLLATQSSPAVLLTPPSPTPLMSSPPPIPQQKQLRPPVLTSPPPPPPPSPSSSSSSASSSRRRRNVGEERRVVSLPYIYTAGSTMTTTTTTINITAAANNTDNEDDEKERVNDNDIAKVYYDDINDPLVIPRKIANTETTSLTSLSSSSSLSPSPFKSKSFFTTSMKRYISSNNLDNLIATRPLKKISSSSSSSSSSVSSLYFSSQPQTFVTKSHSFNAKDYLLPSSSSSTYNIKNREDRVSFHRETSSKEHLSSLPLLQKFPLPERLDDDDDDHKQQQRRYNNVVGGHIIGDRDVAQRLKKSKSLLRLFKNYAKTHPLNLSSTSHPLKKLIESTKMSTKSFETAPLQSLSSSSPQPTSPQPTPSSELIPLMSSSYEKTAQFCCDKLKCFRIDGFTHVDGLACGKCKCFSYCRCSCLSWQKNQTFCCENRCILLTNDASSSSSLFKSYVALCLHCYGRPCVCECVNFKPKDRSHYWNYETRLASFNGWRGSYDNVERLAKYGFFYVASKGKRRDYYDDETRCFNCHLKLFNWEPNDDPLQNHLKYGYRCSFLLKLLTNEKKEEAKGKAIFKPTSSPFSSSSTTTIATASSQRDSSTKFPRFVDENVAELSVVTSSTSDKTFTRRAIVE